MLPLLMESPSRAEVEVEKRRIALLVGALLVSISWFLTDIFSNDFFYYSGGSMIFSWVLMQLSVRKLRRWGEYHD